jgi:AraC-like DNA-binding protein
MPLLVEVEEFEAAASRSTEDVLSAVLQAVRMTGAVFFDNDARGTWASATPTVAELSKRVMPDFGYVIPFHLVTVGQVWFWIVDRPESAVLVKAGEVVMFPHGDEHIGASEPGLYDKANLEDWNRHGRPLPIPYNINPSGEGAVCRFVCGYLGFDNAPFNPLLKVLPAMIHSQTSDMSRRLLVNLVAAALEETSGHRAGGETMLARAAELMFVEVLRNYIAAAPQSERNWFSALRDRHIGRALHLIHSRPAEGWTIDRLARSVGLSRTVFAERFVEYVGMAPITYLTSWRMQLAARRLEDSGTSVAQAAVDVGYESEAAFRRAFKRTVGETPGDWQRRRAEVVH